MTLRAKILERSGKVAQMELEWEPPSLPLAAVLESVGTTPLPPYMRREASPSDRCAFVTMMLSLK